MRLAIVLAILALSLAGAAADNAAFLFPEKPAQENMNLEYGEKALSERLYKNAIRYLTLFSEEAKGRPEKAKAATLLSQAYLLDGQPRKALDAVNGFLAKDPLADDLPTRSRLFLTAGEACNALGEHATALNFLQPLMKELETAPHEREAQTLCAIAEAWNATGKWVETTNTLAPRLESGDFSQEERVALTWRVLDASLAQGNWKRLREYVNSLLAMDVTQDEKTTLMLLHLRCDLAEGEMEAALAYYSENDLEKRLPNSADKQWWEILTSLANACQSKGLKKEAAQFYGDAVPAATTEADALKAAKLQAECLLAAGEWDAAKKCLNSIRQKLPKDASITLRLAQTKLALDERRGAAELFLVVANDEAAPRESRYTAAMQAAECLAKEGLSEDASTAFLLAKELGATDEQKAIPLRKAAEQAERGKRTNDAIRLYAMAADSFGGTNETAMEARLEAGRLLLASGKRDEAIDQYTLYMDARPDSPRRWEALIAIASATTDNDEAIASLLEVARNCPVPETAAQAYFEAHARAVSKGSDGLDSAMGILQEFLGKFPDANQETLRNARHRLVAIGLAMDNPEAVAWGKAFVKDYPDSHQAPEVAIRMGDWLAGEGRHEEAIELYRGVKDLKRATAEMKAVAIYEEAFCQNGEGKRKEALATLADFETHTGDATLQARAAFLRGDALASLDDPEAAIEAYTRAREAGGESELALAALGRIAELQYAGGEVQKARKCLTEILQKTAYEHPEIKARAKLLMARCCRDTDDTRTAIDYYNEIRVEYEKTRERNVPPATPTQVYVAAVQELLEILDKNTTDAKIVRRNYAENKDLPPLP